MIKTYIITPFQNDFRRQCEGLHGHHACRPNCNLSKWIDSVEKLYGLAIHRDDLVIIGEQFYEFEPKMLEAIQKEMVIRRWYGKENNDAIQKQSTNARDVCQPTRDRKALGKGNAEPKKATRKSKEKETKKEG